MRHTPKIVLWFGVLVLVGAAVGAGAILAHSSSSSGSSASSSAEVATNNGSSGTAIDLPVPRHFLHLPLTNQHGQRVDLASWSGKTVLLVPFLTLCSDICPLTTGNLVQLQRSLRADRAASRVQIVELTVDPHRDLPTRLAAYARLTSASWQLVTETPTDLAALAKFFGFTYEKVPEDKPPSIDWWTGKPLTYDIDHSDNYFVIDPAGNERVVQDAAPDFRGYLNPRIHHFLSGLGRRHLRYPPQPDWTPRDALRALGLVLNRSLPVNLSG
ncbi:MAG TPA: SCO family protein [Solirubrobacterales bacterium]|nr:SCO family protein [Solirubrobacterales bacterium]